MMYKFNLLCCLVIILGGGKVLGQRHYVCYYTATRPVIDGSGDEPAWQQAPWTEDFMDIKGDAGPRPPLRTRAKLLWDKEFLYIYAELEESDLWATLRQHDTIVYDDNDFEVFIDPKNDTHDYFELEINALGTEMDLFLAKPYRNGGKALLSWDAQGLRSAVRTKGTLNRPGDIDQGWSVEMAIPQKSIHFWGDKPVQNGSLWRINFSRVEWDRDVKEGRYIPRVDPASGRRLSEHNWVWSPQGIIDMHAPEQWGYLQFSAHTGGVDTTAFIPPADEQARLYLWQIYYRQQEYRRVHGAYAKSLKELGGFSTLSGKVDMPGEITIVVDEKGDSYELKMEALTTQFTAMVSRQNPAIWVTIDQDGKIGTGTSGH